MNPIKTQKQIENSKRFLKLFHSHNRVPKENGGFISITNPYYESSYKMTKEFYEGMKAHILYETAEHGPVPKNPYRGKETDWGKFNDWEDGWLFLLNSEKFQLKQLL